MSTIRIMGSNGIMNALFIKVEALSESKQCLLKEIDLYQSNASQIAT
jgi:hypothetical protein